MDRSMDDGFKNQNSQLRPIRMENEFKVEKILKNHGVSFSYSTTFRDQEQQILQRILTMQHENDESCVANKLDLSEINRSMLDSMVSENLQKHTIEINQSTTPIKTFTLNSAYQQIGGFGKFQIIATILLVIIRNFGMPQLYMSGIATQKQMYECFNDLTQDWSVCETQYICEQRQLNHTNFQYRLETANEHYIKNWYVTMDLMCVPETTYSRIPAAYFIGYGVGTIIFFLPDRLGRKSTMNLVLPIYAICATISIYGQNIEQKMFGFFLQGFFHIKISNSITHCVELVPEVNKSSVVSAIIAFDAGTLMYNCLIILFYKAEIHLGFQIFHFVGCLAIILYMLIIPESPKWLFLNQGSQSKQARKELNYIAWFNGSIFRVPENAIFDCLGQVIEENQTMMDMNLTRNRNQANITLYQDVLGIEEQYMDTNHKTKTMHSSVLKEIKLLMLDKRYNITQFKLMLLAISVNSLYYLGLFSSEHVRGNPFIIGICFGVTELIGVVCGGKILHYKIKDTTAMFIALIIILASSMMLKNPDISQSMIYGLFLLEIFCLGIAYNILFVLMDTRTTNPKLLSTSFELSLSTGQFFTMLCPIVCKMGEPYMTALVWFYALLSIYMINIMPKNQKPNSSKETLISNIERSLLNIFKSEDNNSNSGGLVYQNNLSSLLFDNQIFKRQILEQWQMNKHNEEDEGFIDDDDSD